MRRDGFLSMSHHRFGLVGRHIALAFAMAAIFPVSAQDKEDMPDLGQIEQTCMPTSTANLIIWFGKHGYPKLILGEKTESEDDRDLHTVHRIMADTDARFDLGTQMEKVTGGIKKYIQDAGYDCDVEYRGLGAATPFTADWFKENDDTNKGFILVLVYSRYDSTSGTFTNAWHSGHAVTLVTAEPDMLLVHDPAHLDDQSGRKILTPHVLTGGIWRGMGGSAPVSGLMTLSGSLLDAPPSSEVLLMGAVCVTMHPAGHPGSASPAPAHGPADTIAGTGSSQAPSKASPASESWITWFFDLFFRK